MVAKITGNLLVRSNALFFISMFMFFCDPMHVMALRQVARAALRAGECSARSFLSRPVLQRQRCMATARRVPPVHDTSSSTGLRSFIAQRPDMVCAAYFGLAVASCAAGGELCATSFC
jgi:hypothetical protein